MLTISSDSQLVIIWVNEQSRKEVHLHIIKQHVNILKSCIYILIKYEHYSLLTYLI